MASVLGGCHDPVYAAVPADWHTIAWLEIVGTTDAIVTSLRSYAMVPSRFDRAIITRSTCDMTLQSRALCTCTADCTSSALLSDLKSRCDYGRVGDCNVSIVGKSPGSHSDGLRQ